MELTITLSQDQNSETSFAAPTRANQTAWKKRACISNHAVAIPTKNTWDKLALISKSAWANINPTLPLPKPTSTYPASLNMLVSARPAP